MRGLLHDLMRKESKGACLTCGADTNERLRMEVQLHKMTEAKEKLERNMKAKEEEAKKKDEQILDLTSSITVTEKQLAAATEERDTLREDVANTAAGKDELIKKAWDVRDAAVKRKNNTMIELAKARIDVMQINSQLLEAIQQKVELSQQLDQWQGDMEELLEEQMVKKMRAQETSARRNRNGNAAAGGGTSLLGVPILGGGGGGGGNKSGNESDSSQAARERKTSKILQFFQGRMSSSAAASST